MRAFADLEDIRPQRVKSDRRISLCESCKLSDAEIEKLAAEGTAWSEDRAVEEALKV
jgi:lipocalin